MNNQEKAKEIYESLKFTPQSGSYFGALKMAEWKDQQFKEYLEKKKEGIENAIMVFGGDLIKYTKVDLLKEIINELFKEEQK